MIRELADLWDEAEEMIQVVKKDHKPSKTFLLYSGGKDSSVLLDVAHRRADAVVHINTGIGIPETSRFAQERVESYGLPFIELHPPRSYREMVLNDWDGFPGPGMHRYTYINLKERCIAALLREHRTYRGEPFVLLAGARKDESERRMGNAEAVTKKGGQIWVNPLLTWTNEEMAEWRQVKEIPLSEVAYNLHMSGECFCGAYAHPGELDEIRFFYPEFAAEIDALAAEAVEKGLTYCEWGVKRSRSTFDPNQGVFELFEPLCSDCAYRWAS